MKALLAEDDFVVRDAVFRLLREARFDVVSVLDGQAAISEARSHSYDLLVLDLGLPKFSGLEVIRSLRAIGSDVPIIIISGRSEAVDCVSGLDSGADDYVVKPFRPLELDARIRALLRRRNPSWGSRRVLGALEYDRVRRTFRADDDPLRLSSRESEILEVLIEHAEDLVRKDALMRRLSHWGQEVSSNLVDVYLHKLRRRLSPIGIEIQTVRGLGYVLSQQSGVSARMCQGKNGLLAG